MHMYFHVTKTFLVGERVTLADITVVCNLLLLYKQVGRSVCVCTYAWVYVCVCMPGCGTFTTHTLLTLFEFTTDCDGLT